MSSYIAKQFFDVFSKEEITQILTMLEKLNKLGISYDNDPGYNNLGYKKTDFIFPAMKKLVHSKLETIFNKPINFELGRFLTQSDPYHIHTDYFYSGKEEPDLVVIIPLNTEEINANTVIFNEECLDHVDIFMKTNEKLKHNARDLHETYMSHELIDRLERVSLLDVYKWIPGSVIVWDRKLLHASDNFITTGVAMKKALIIHTAIYND
jgi:hypothetical protein